MHTDHNRNTRWSSLKVPLIGVAAVLLLTAAPRSPAVTLDEVLEPIESSPETTARIDQEHLAMLLDYGIEQRLMIFEIFNRVVLHLSRLDRRARIDGSDLRHIARRYDLGGDRVASLLPTEKVEAIFLGAARDREQGQLEVFLEEEHDQYLEIADISLSEHYGFHMVKPDLFDDGFGAGVKRFIFSFNLDSIEIYEKGKIAIRVRGFGRPKRWRINRVSRIPEDQKGD